MGHVVININEKKEYLFYFIFLRCFERSLWAQEQKKKSFLRVLSRPDSEMLYRATVDLTLTSHVW